MKSYENSLATLRDAMAAHRIGFWATRVRGVDIMATAEPTWFRQGTLQFSVDVLDLTTVKGVTARVGKYTLAIGHLLGG